MKYAVIEYSPDTQAAVIPIAQMQCFKCGHKIEGAIFAEHNSGILLRNNTVAEAQTHHRNTEIRKRLENGDEVVQVRGHMSFTLKENNHIIGFAKMATETFMGYVFIQGSNSPRLESIHKAVANFEKYE